MSTFQLFSSPLKIDTRKKDMQSSRAGLPAGQAGAFVSFEGWVRDHNDGRKVIALEYEAFDKLCDKEGKRIIEEAKEKFSIIDVQCLHRTGKLNIGDLAVWVGVTAAHRDDAFEACRFVIDEVKSRLPIWKKEFYENGVAVWVGCEQGGAVKSRQCVSHES